MRKLNAMLTPFIAPFAAFVTFVSILFGRERREVANDELIKKVA